MVRSFSSIDEASAFEALADACANNTRHGAADFRAASAWLSHVRANRAPTIAPMRVARPTAVSASGRLWGAFRALWGSYHG